MEAKMGSWTKPLKIPIFMAIQDQLSFSLSVPRLCKLVNQELQQPEASQKRRMISAREC